MLKLRLSQIVACAALFVSSVGVAYAATEELKLDAEKSKITFVGHKPDGTKHEGGFKKFSVDASADFEDPSKGSLKIEIATESLWSDDDKLTEHLKNPDFFDVRKYPKAVFESTGIKHDDATGEVKIVGKLKLLAKTEEMTVPVEVEMTDESLKLVAKFKIDRMKWGMTYGQGKINDEVDIVADLVFKR